MEEARNGYDPVLMNIDWWTTVSPVSIMGEELYIKPAKPIDYSPPSQSPQEVVETLEELGGFLHGSREKFNNRNFDDPTDWDFAVDYHQIYNNDWIKNSINKDFNPALSSYINNNFNYKPSPYYRDKLHYELWEHSWYDNITIQVKNNLTLYKRSWNKLPTWYYSEYLWKSNPKIKERLGEDKEKIAKFKKFRTDTFNMLYEVLEIPLIEEFI